MLKLNFIYIFIFLSFLFQSCTVALPVMKARKDRDKKVTHSQVMDRYKTKKDVIRGFGAPTSKETLEGLEIWYYDKGSSTSTYSSGNAKTNITSYSGINANTRANARSTTTTYSKYVEFQFENDLVFTWRSKGVDYGSSPTWLWHYIIGLSIDAAILLLTFS